MTQQFLIEPLIKTEDSAVGLYVDLGSNIPTCEVVADGSPTPSSVTVDNLPSLPDPVQLVGVADPFGLGELPEINNELYAQLLDLGFDDFTARLALIRTANTGVEEAVNWIIERSNPSDFEDNSSSSDGGEDVEMGGGRTHKMVLVANMSLKMGTGKLAAQ
ncbi:UBA/TS-N domain protein, partial [Ostertagia ostertagi]